MGVQEMPVRREERSIEPVWICVVCSFLRVRTAACANSKGCVETARMCRLVKRYVNRICVNTLYVSQLTRPVFVVVVFLSCFYFYKLVVWLAWIVNVFVAFSQRGARERKENIRETGVKTNIKLTPLIPPLLNEPPPRRLSTPTHTQPLFIISDKQNKTKNNIIKMK